MIKARSQEILSQDRAFVVLFPFCLVLSIAFLGVAMLIDSRISAILSDPVIFFLSDVFLAFGMDVYLWLLDEHKMKKREGKR